MQVENARTLPWRPNVPSANGRARHSVPAVPSVLSRTPLRVHGKGNARPEIKTIAKKKTSNLGPIQLRALGTLLLLLLPLCSTCSAAEITNLLEDWPQFLGPRADGTSQETGLVEKWGEKGPAQLWDQNVGKGYSAPSVRGDFLILHHRLGENEVVEAFNPSNGKSLWKYTYPSLYIDPYGYNNGPRSCPLLTSNRCYAFGAEGKLLCLELQTGKLLWQRDTAHDWEIPQAFFGVGSSPVLESGLLIVMVGGQPNSGIVAFDPETGKTVWESVGEKNWQGIPMTGWPGENKVNWQRFEKQASYSTPVAATVNGKRQIFALMRQGLVALDPTNGAVNFSYWFRSRLNDSVNAANPKVVGDSVFISGAYYHVGSVLLKVKPVSDGLDEVWRGTVLEIHWNTPIYHDGYLYAFSGRNEPDAHFKCVEFKTGKEMWDRDERWIGHQPASPTYGRGSAIMADGKLIVLGEAGLLGLFKLNPKAPEEICRAQIAQLQYPCWAAPILSHHRLYVRSEKHLVCFDVNKKSGP